MEMNTYKRIGTGLAFFACGALGLGGGVLLGELERKLQGPTQTLQTQQVVESEYFMVTPIDYTQDVEGIFNSTGGKWEGLVEIVPVCEGERRTLRSFHVIPAENPIGPLTQEVVNRVVSEIAVALEQPSERIKEFKYTH